MKIILCILYIALLYGCASGPTHENKEPADANAAAGSNLICRKEREIGSYIPKTVCRTKAQKEEEQEIAGKIIDKIRDKPDNY